MNNIIIIVLIYTSSQVDYSHGHASLINPPSRAYKFKEGFTGADGKLQENYDHNGVNCGGRDGFKRNHGKCGICGDPWDEEPPRKHEAPGRFAGGKVTGQYQPGQIIQVEVLVTANHQGFFTFDICANNRTDRDPDQSCFERLKIKDSSISNNFKYKSYPPYIQDKTTQLPIGTTLGSITIKLELPGSIQKCSRCILQWTYTCGNDWNGDSCGMNCEDNICAKGCGYQETFRACADVSIMSENNPLPGTKNPLPGTENPLPSTENTTIVPEETTTGVKEEPAESTPPPAEDSNSKPCMAIGPWTGIAAMDNWCLTNCNWSPSFCPGFMCKCG